MRRFNVEGNLSIIISIMMVLGTWPKDSVSVLHKIRGFTTASFIIIGVMITSNNVLKFGDIQVVCFSLCCWLVLINTTLKYVCIFIKRKDLFNLMGMLNHPVLSLHKRHLYEFLNRKAKMVRFFQCTFILSAVGTGILITAGPIFSKRPVPLPFFVDMEGQGFLLYGLAWLLETCATMLTCVSISTFDGLIFFFIAVAGAELQILKEKIIDSAYVSSLDSINAQDQCKFDQRINRLLKKCVLQHIAIERYVLSIQTTFTNAFLIQLGITLTLTCFVGLMLIIVPIASFDFGMCCLFFVATIYELVLFCVAGNEIILQSEKLRDACYMSDWINCGTSVRKTLFIIMERTKRPLQLSAANFIVLSIDTLVSVCRSAFSYFTVLNRMYGESNKD